MGDRIEREWSIVRTFALGFPSAEEDLPWGFPIIKVATGSAWPPAFVWMGTSIGDRGSVVVKLTASYEQAKALTGAVPTTHSGVGRYGRLTVPLGVVDVELLCDWVDESYREVAPKRLRNLLDARATTAVASSADVTRDGESGGA